MARAVFTDKQKRFLELWKEAGTPQPTLSAFCKAHGFARGLVYNWRRRPEFKAAMDNPGTDLDELGRLKALAKERWPTLPAWQGIWLEVWRQSRDRLTACEQVQKTWEEIEAEVEGSERFKAGYDVIEREILIGVEDAHTRAALAGKTSATGSYLEARKSKLAKSAGKGGESPRDSENPQKVKERYAEIFGRHTGERGKEEGVN